MGGHGLGTHSVLGLALISEMRSLNLAPSVLRVLYAYERTTKEGIPSFPLPDTLKSGSFYEIIGHL